MRQNLAKGRFASLTEVAKYYGKSSSSVTKYKQQGERLGLWTEREVSDWIKKGKRLRRIGKTEPTPRKLSEDELWEELDEIPEGF